MPSLKTSKPIAKKVVIDDDVFETIKTAEKHKKIQSPIKSVAITVPKPIAPPKASILRLVFYF